MIRELSGHDPTRFAAVRTIRVRDGLDAYVERMRERALEEFRHQQGLYAAGALKKAPTPPDILRDA